MKFTGKALLLEVSEYETKVDPKKEGEEPTLETRYKYVFLIGDQKDELSFVENAHVESCVADHPLLTGKEKVFSSIDVEISIREFVNKVNGVFQRVQKPVYQVVDLNEKAGQ